jgi:hypothetical protein
VRHIEHLFAKGIEAGSDHAPVVVDLDLTARPGKEEDTDDVVAARSHALGSIQAPSADIPLVISRRSAA